MASSRKLTDHQEIRTWAEEHGGRPSKVDTGGEGGVLRLDFQEKDDNLTEIEWDEFFDIFEDSELALLVGDEEDSRFNKFVSR